MAKRNVVANKIRTATSKGNSIANQVVIVDENPKEVAYNNPPGFKYVRAAITDVDGETQESIICMSIDQIERMKKGK